MDIAKRQLEEEERLFSNVQLTDKERKIIELNKRLFDFAEKRKNNKDEVVAYQMPDTYDDNNWIDFNKKFNVLY